LDQQRVNRILHSRRLDFLKFSLRNPNQFITRQAMPLLSQFRKHKATRVVQAEDVASFEVQHDAALLRRRGEIDTGSNAESRWTIARMNSHCFLGWGMSTLDHGA